MAIQYRGGDRVERSTLGGGDVEEGRLGEDEEEEEKRRGDDEAGAEAIC